MSRVPACSIHTPSLASRAAGTRVGSLPARQVRCQEGPEETQGVAGPWKSSADRTRPTNLHPVAVPARCSLLLLCLLAGPVAGGELTRYNLSAVRSAVQNVLVEARAEMVRTSPLPGAPSLTMQLGFVSDSGEVEPRSVLDSLQCKLMNAMYRCLATTRRY